MPATSTARRCLFKTSSIRDAALDVMSGRSREQMEAELAAFDRFRAAYPSFAKDVVSIVQPDPWPDIEARLQGGKKQDVELGEWIDGQQLAALRGRLCAEELSTPPLR
jgi:hypothetical protein